MTTASKLSPLRIREPSWRRALYARRSPAGSASIGRRVRLKPGPPRSRRRSLLGEPCGDRREAAVDVGNLAGDGTREIGQEERCDVADLVDGHVPAERRVLLDEIEDLREAADPGGRERLDRAGRDAVDADLLGTHARGEIADVRLEAC